MKFIKSDSGNVIVDFIGVTVALLVPLSIIANSSIMVANAYLSTDIAARSAARAFVVSSSDASGTRAANSAVGLIANDFDREKNDVSTRISCTMSPCLSPGGYVTIRISKEVNLNLPRALGVRSVTVTSHHTSVVDELRTQ